MSLLTRTLILLWGALPSDPVTSERPWLLTACWGFSSVCELGERTNARLAAVAVTEAWLSCHKVSSRPWPELKATARARSGPITVTLAFKMQGKRALSVASGLRRGAGPELPAPHQGLWASRHPKWRGPSSFPVVTLHASAL